MAAATKFTPELLPPLPKLWLYNYTTFILYIYDNYKSIL